MAAVRLVRQAGRSAREARVVGGGGRQLRTWNICASCSQSSGSKPESLSWVTSLRNMGWWLFCSSRSPPPVSAPCLWTPFQHANRVSGLRRHATNIQTRLKYTAGSLEIEDLCQIPQTASSVRDRSQA